MNQSNQQNKIQPCLLVIMDGVGESTSDKGNAVRKADTPHLDLLRKNCLFTTIQAHGTAVGLPTDGDMGNSEVGHNAMGSGQVFPQGASLINQAFESGALFEGETWKTLSTQNRTGCLHLIGLLSDGKVHSHIDHLFTLMDGAKQARYSKVVLQLLLDGRDVPPRSAERYLKKLEQKISTLQERGLEVLLSSLAGRMRVTMDRYGADWAMVERGYRLYTEGEADYSFQTWEEALQYFREEKNLDDQNLPAFTLPNFTPLRDGDACILFNFRGDRAIEICQALDDPHFDQFNRPQHPDVLFAGMMEYDGDLHIPKRYLVAPPSIENTLGEYLANDLKLRQFACSESQKFGHVTYFWNGNRSGKFSEERETYQEVPSLDCAFDAKPEMRAFEITDATLEAIRSKQYDFLRINFANGDMVGHTGNFEAAVKSMEAVDACIGRLIEAATEYGLRLMVTADHGNCEEMLDSKDTRKMKTSHTLNPVPLYIFGQGVEDTYEVDAEIKDRGLPNLANTILVAMNLTPQARFRPSIIRRKK